MGAGGLASEADAVMGLTCGCGCDGWVACLACHRQDPSRLPCDRMHPEVFGIRCRSATGNRVLFQNKSLELPRFDKKSFWSLYLRCTSL